MSIFDNGAEDDNFNFFREVEEHLRNVPSPAEKEKQTE